MGGVFLFGNYRSLTHYQVSTLSGESCAGSPDRLSRFALHADHAAPNSVIKGKLGGGMVKRWLYSSWYLQWGVIEALVSFNCALRGMSRKSFQLLKYHLDLLYIANPIKPPVASQYHYLCHHQTQGFCHLSLWHVVLLLKQISLDLRLFK